MSTRRLGPLRGRPRGSNTTKRATPFDKLAVHHQATVYIAAINEWL